MKKIESKKTHGFTLIELLIVMGVLGILLSIVLVAINPTQHFRQANNTQRMSDVKAILSAVNQYVINNKGVLPSGSAAPTKPQVKVDPSVVELCTSKNTKAEVDLKIAESLIVKTDPKIIEPVIIVDPKCADYADSLIAIAPISITSTSTTIASGTGNINLCAALVPTYLADLPSDPTSGSKTPTSSICTASTTYNTGYTIRTASNNHITVAAPSAELGAVISVTQ
jgi:prepilin-type N-terminal cleavage/methylation domain-containing protein